MYALDGLSTTRLSSRGESYERGRNRFWISTCREGWRYGALRQSDWQGYEVFKKEDAPRATGAVLAS